MVDVCVVLGAMALMIFTPDSSSMEIDFAAIIISIISSPPNFAHAMTTNL